MKERIVAAMSGGVDSSVAAALLLEQGYEVVGVTLNVWPEEDSCPGARSCCSQTDVDDARQVCAQLGIPHYVLNMRELFRQRVIDYFVRSYLKGLTPNPCIACNEAIKLGALLHRTRELGAAGVATGHYALPWRDPETGGRSLTRSADRHKDQTYVLYSLSQEQLSALRLPCGGMTKDEVRAAAKKFGLPTFQKAESQDICFIGREGYQAFIRGYCAEHGLPLPPPGPVVDTQGRVLGRHEGVFGFTVGQRRGLGKYTNRRSFVVRIDPSSATVVLGEESDLYSGAFRVGRPNILLPRRLADGARAGVKIRYSAPQVSAAVRFEQDGSLLVVPDVPVKSVTPGQAAVFYDGDLLLGGGTILSAGHSPVKPGEESFPE